MSSARLATATDVDALIDERPMARVQVLVAVLCALTVFFDGYDIQVMALAVSALAQEWGLASSRFGMALAAVVVGLTLGAALLSPLGDRFGRRAIVIVSLVLVGVTTACTALANSPEQFTAWRFLTGIGLGMLRGAVMIQAGGVLGGVMLALFLDSGKAVAALRAAFVLAAVCLALFLVVPSGAAWTLMLLLIGGGVAGTQLSLNALSTAYYPPAIKATGTGWAAVIGNLAPWALPWPGRRSSISERPR